MEVKPMWAERTSSGESEARTYRIVYDVWTDFILGPLTVAGAVMAVAPQVFSWQGDVDPQAYRYSFPAASPVAPESQSQRKHWRVPVIYSTRPREQCRAEYASPLDEPPIWSGSFVERLVVAAKDRNGDPIVNSADEPFDPAIEIDKPNDTVLVTFNTASISISTRANAAGKVNADTYWGLAARTIRLRQWLWQPLISNDQCQEYVRNTMEFEINKDKWDHERLDEGFREKIVAGGVVKTPEIRDSMGRKLTMPRPLDGNGAKLTDAKIIAGEFEYLTFEAIDQVDFFTLPIPSLPSVVS